MITDNSCRKKALRVFLSLIALTLILTSCSTPTDSYNYLFTGSKDDIEEPLPETDRFIIVLPSDCSGAVYDASKARADKIEKNTSAETLLIYEHQNADIQNDDMLILIGKTSYAESQIFIHDFRSDDFGYTYSNKTVVIGGRSEKALLSAIEKFYNDIVLYADSELFISNGAKYIFRAEYDIERITGKISNKNVNAKDLVSLKKSLDKLPEIKEKLKDCKSELLERWHKELDTLDNIQELLNESLLEDPSITLKEGNIIKAGYSVEVDKLRDIKLNGKQWIASLEQSERDYTGIKSLKVGYNLL